MPMQQANFKSNYTFTINVNLSPSRATLISFSLWIPLKFSYIRLKRRKERNKKVKENVKTLARKSVIARTVWSERTC